MQEKERLKSKTIVSMGWVLLEQCSSKVVSLVVQIVLARILDPEAFGVLAILLVFVNIADVLVRGGLNMALIQRLDVTAKDYSTVFWFSLVCASILYLLIFLCAPLVAQFYQMPSLVLFLRVLALVLFANTLNSVQVAYLSRNLEFKKLFKGNFCAVFISGALGIVAAMAGFGVWALVVQNMAAAFISCLAFSFMVPWRPRFEFSLVSMKSLFVYAWKVAATGILGAFYANLSNLVIGKVCSATDLGFYSQGEKIPISIMAIIQNTIQNVLFPAFSKIQSNLELMRIAVRRAIMSGCFFVVPASVILAIVAEPLVSLVFTDKWLPCVPVLQLVCISQAFMILQTVNLRAYMALGKSGLFLKLQIIKITIGLVMLCIAAFVFRDVYVIAAFSCLSQLVFVLVVDMAPAKRVLAYSRAEQLKDIAPTCLCALASGLCAYALSWLILSNSLILLLTQFVVFLLMYWLLSRLFKLESYMYCKETFSGFREQWSNRSHERSDKM